MRKKEYIYFCSGRNLFMWVLVLLMSLLSFVGVVEIYTYSSSSGGGGFFSSNVSDVVVIREVSVLDSGGRRRRSFSNTESITLRVVCEVLVEVSRVEFSFYIYDPHGREVFSHVGNSMAGRRGYGGSELKNIPIVFYTHPGRYTLRAVVSVPEVNFMSQKETDFVIYSPNIILTYPPNGARDILASPLVLRWVSSGATRYRVYVGDDTSFYRPLWTGETENTEITYPIEPENSLARLSGGKTYFWKVEGIDIDGKVIATTPLPFSFTIKDTAIPSSKDLAVESIEFEEIREDGVLVLRARVRNLGNQAASAVSFDVSIAEMRTKMPPQNIDIIQANEVRDVVFSCGEQLPAEMVERAETETLPLTVTAVLNIYDDNPKNNTLTRVVRVPLAGIRGKKGRVSGKVYIKGSKGSEAIRSAIVWFSGPANVYAMTDDKGEYSVDNLSLGEYRVKVSHEEYIDSEERVIVVSKTKTTHTNVDFELEPKKKAPPPLPAIAKEEREAAAVSTTEKTPLPGEEKKKREVPSYTMKEIWEIIKARLPDTYLIKELEAYILTSVCSVEEEEVDINEIIEKISTGKISIMGYNVVEEDIEKQPSAAAAETVTVLQQQQLFTLEEEGIVAEEEAKKKKQKQKEKRRKPYTLKEIWGKIKPHISEKAVVRELDTYTLLGVVLLPERDVDIEEVVDKISSGEIKIISCNFEEEEKEAAAVVVVPSVVAKEEVMLPSKELEVVLSQQELYKIWSRIKPYIPCDKQLLDDFDEYSLQKIVLSSPMDDINKIVEDIEAKKIKITGYRVVVEK